LEEVQMKEYEQLLVTPVYQGARKYGKTSFEQGQLVGQQKLLRQQLANRFGPLSEEVRAHLESCSEEQLLQLADKILTASSLRELGLEP